MQNKKSTSFEVDFLLFRFKHLLIISTILVSGRALHESECFVEPAIQMLSNLLIWIWSVAGYVHGNERMNRYDLHQ